MAPDGARWHHVVPPGAIRRHAGGQEEGRPAARPAAGRRGRKDGSPSRVSVAVAADRTALALVGQLCGGPEAGPPSPVSCAVAADRTVLAFVGQLCGGRTPSRVSFQSTEPNRDTSIVPFACTQAMIVFRISSELAHTCFAEATCGKLPPPLAR